MKYVDFTAILDGDPAYLALMATYQLDPDFFERRLLRSSILGKARRIIVFMDHNEWHSLRGQDAAARLLNRRYLVVPVRCRHGVFHPKLNLILSEPGGLLTCGSNNLTRSGCTSNLELLNSFSFSFEDGEQQHLDLARQAFAFFKRASSDAEKGAVRIANEWMEEAETVFPTLGDSAGSKDDGSIRLIHTYQGSLWDTLKLQLAKTPPRRLLVVSPFHDLDGGLCRRVLAQWPKCRIELVVQNGITVLSSSMLKKLSRSVSLAELSDASRRLHAKLIAWETATGTGCLVGSANFTSAAFDGRNAETCLLLPDAGKMVDSLFDASLSKKPLSLKDFESGSESEPTPKDDGPTELQLDSAILTAADELRISFQCSLKPSDWKLRVAIRLAGEADPRALAPLSNPSGQDVSVPVPQSALSEIHGVILASIIATAKDSKDRVESNPVWVIQEDRLTYESSGDGASTPGQRIEESGAGLNEFLDELGTRSGVAGIVEYLNQLMIRFNDGGGAFGASRRFRLRIRDPFQPDVAPAWLLSDPSGSTDLADAIYDFVTRHETKRLRKHAERGNINGIENFLDIFRTMIRLLFVYYTRKVVKRGYLIEFLCNYIALSTSGINSSDDACKGYLFSVFANLDCDSRLLQEACDRTGFTAEIWAALMIAQKVRFQPNERIDGKTVTRPREILQSQAKAVSDALSRLRLKAPATQSIVKALESYEMFSESDLAGFRNELDL